MTTKKTLKIRTKNNSNILQSENVYFNNVIIAFQEDESIDILSGIINDNDKYRGEAIHSDFKLDEDTFSSDLYSNFKILPKRSFIDILEKFYTNEFNQYNTHILIDILIYAWDSIVYNSGLAQQILNIHELRDKNIWDILNPLCKLSLGIAIESDDVLRFILFSEHFSEYKDSIIYYHDILTAKFLKRLLYSNQNILVESDILGIISNLVSCEDRYWQHYFIDIYFRNICNFLYLEQDLYKIISSIEEKLKNIPISEPLSILYQFIQSPYEAHNKTDFDNFIEIINHVSYQCKSVIECRWTISALLRMLPLYSTSDDITDYSKYINGVFKRFDRKLISTSSFLQFLYLDNLIIEFLKTKNPNFILEFEQNFIYLKSKLNPLQVIQLQTEYVSCLYLSFTLLYYEDYKYLNFCKIVLDNNDPLDSILFKNFIIDYKFLPHEDLNIHNRSDMKRWLYLYLKRLYEKYIKIEIDNSFQRVFHFRATTRVFPIRPFFCRDVCSSFYKMENSDLSKKPEFCANSISAFRFLNCEDDTEIILRYIKSSLESDIYYLILNSKNILHSLFACFYYGPTENQEEAYKLAIQIVQKIYNFVQIPKLYLAYYAGIIFKESKIEQQFVFSLFEILNKKYSKKYEFLNPKNRLFEVTFPDTVLDLIDEYSKKESFFASIASNEMNNPEIWNIIATTIFNNTVINNTACDNTYNLIAASLFYSYAKCFSRVNIDFDQKYCYNYIRTKSLYYIYTDIDFEDISFIEDTLNYIQSPNSFNFSHIPDCMDPFINLLSNEWSKIPEEIKNILQKKISTRNKMVKKLLIKYKLL